MAKCNCRVPKLLKSLKLAKPSLISCIEDWALWKPNQTAKKGSREWEGLSAVWLHRMNVEREREREQNQKTERD